MQTLPITLIVVHVVSAVFWAGSTFVLARLRGAGAASLFRPQVGAAIVAVLSGGWLGHVLHGGRFGLAEIVLSIGVATALLALVVLLAAIGPALRKAEAGQRRVALGYRASAGLLLVTVVCMSASRYL